MEQAWAGLGGMIKSGWATTTDIAENIGDGVTNVASNLTTMASGAAQGSFSSSLDISVHPDPVYRPLLTFFPNSISLPRECISLRFHLQIQALSR